LTRELEEEMGIRVEPRAEVLEHELNHATRCISYFILTSRVSAPAPRLNPLELLDYRFCGPECLPDGLEPSHARVLDRYWRGQPNQLLVVPSRGPA
jgi:hypothetical protein